MVPQSTTKDEDLEYFQENVSGNESNTPVEQVSGFCEREFIWMEPCVVSDGGLVELDLHAEQGNSGDAVGGIPVVRHEQNGSGGQKQHAAAAATTSRQQELG